MSKDRGDTQASIFPIASIFAPVPARKWLTHNMHGPLHSAPLTLGLTHQTRSWYLRKALAMLLATQSESNRQEVTELMQGTGHSLPS